MSQIVILGPWVVCFGNIPGPWLALRFLNSKILFCKAKLWRSIKSIWIRRQWMMEVVTKKKEQMFENNRQPWYVYIYIHKYTNVYVYIIPSGVSSLQRWQHNFQLLLHHPSSFLSPQGVTWVRAPDRAEPKAMNDWWTTIDGRNPAPVDRYLSHYLWGFIHSRWCRVSSINSRKIPDNFFGDSKNYMVERTCINLLCSKFWCWERSWCQFKAIHGTSLSKFRNFNRHVQQELDVVPWASNGQFKS